MPRYKTVKPTQALSFTTYLQPINDSDDLYLELPQDLLEAVEWRVGDILDFQVVTHGLISVKNNSKAARKTVKESVIQREDEGVPSTSPRDSIPALTWTEILTMAERVLGSNDAANQWLHSPALALNGATPISHAHTAHGVADVKLLLIRIEAGVYM